MTTAVALEYSGLAAVLGFGALMAQWPRACAMCCVAMVALIGVAIVSPSA